MVFAPHSNNLVSPCLPEPRSGLGNASRVRPGPGRKWQTGSAHGGVRCRNHSLRFVTGLLPNSLQRLTRDVSRRKLPRISRGPSAISSSGCRKSQADVFPLVALWTGSKRRGTYLQFYSRSCSPRTLSLHSLSASLRELSLH